jgi:16S rRNA (guanine527-N7)-methyltransferase
MPPANNGRRRLVEGARALGVELATERADQLMRYLDLLLFWNRKINLTAVTDPDEVIDRHFLDSLAVLPSIAGAQSLVDVGSGGGFPGGVLAIAQPELRVACVESIAKKVAFLDTLHAQLAPNLEPLRMRLEGLVDRQFDAAVSRATWDPPEWLPRGAPLVGPGGLLIAMQTGEAPDLSAPPGFSAQPAIRYTISGVQRRLALFRRS